MCVCRLLLLSRAHIRSKTSKLFLLPVHLSSSKLVDFCEFFVSYWRWGATNGLAVTPYQTISSPLFSFQNVNYFWRKHIARSNIWRRTQFPKNSWMFNENSKGLFLTCMCNKVENLIRSSCHQKETVHRTLESLCQLTLVNEKQSLHCTSGIVRWLQNKGHPKFHYHVDSLKNHHHTRYIRIIQQSFCCARQVQQHRWILLANGTFISWRSVTLLIIKRLTTAVRQTMDEPLDSPPPRPWITV